MALITKTEDILVLQVATKELEIPWIKSKQRGPPKVKAKKRITMVLL
jgi:hypothetical protein